MDYIELKKTEIYFPSELWSEIKYFALGKRWNLNNHINDEIHSYRSELKYLKQINKKDNPLISNQKARELVRNYLVNNS